MAETLRKMLAAEVKAIGDRAVRFVVSTGGVDRDNDTIAPSGWRLDAYRRNAVVLWAHNYDQLPIARCTSIGVENATLIAVAEFPPAGLYQFADVVLGMLRAGFLSAVSVGFRPVRAVPSPDRRGTDYAEAELLEFSVVPVPANADALVIARGMGVNRDAVRRWLDEDPVIDIIDDADEPIDVEPADVRAALRDALHECLRDALGEAVGRAFSASHARATGRVLDADPVTDPAARWRGVDATVVRGAIRDLVPSLLADQRRGLRDVIDREIDAALLRRRGRVD